MNNVLRMLIVAVGVTVGCVPTDSGNPPAALDGSNIVGLVENGISGTTVTLSGNAGAVLPESALVYALNLDTTQAVVSAASNADGSFSLAPVFGEVDHRIRLWVANGDVRSEPLDLIVVADRVEQVVSSFPSCVRFTPSYEVDFDVFAAREFTVRVENGCDDAVVFSSVRVRDAATGFAISDPSTPLVSLEAHASRDLLLRSPTSSGLSIDALIFETTAPSVGWAALSLFARR